MTISTETTETTEHLIEHIASTIAAAFRPRPVVLFGSHARGQAGPDSDIDLFVELETERRPPERAIAVSAIFGLHPWAMDIIVYTPEEVARRRQRNDALLATIECEGRVLYERAEPTLRRMAGQSRIALARRVGRAAILAVNPCGRHVFGGGHAVVE